MSTESNSIVGAGAMAFIFGSARQINVYEDIMDAQGFTSMIDAMEHADLHGNRFGFAKPEDFALFYESVTGVGIGLIIAGLFARTFGHQNA